MRREVEDKPSRDGGLRQALRGIATLLLAVAAVLVGEQLLYLRGAVHEIGHVVKITRVTWYRWRDRIGGPPYASMKSGTDAIVAYGPGQTFRWQASSPLVSREIGHEVRLVYHPDATSAPRLDGPGGFATSFFLTLVALAFWLLSRFAGANAHAPVRRKRSGTDTVSRS